MMFEVHSFIMKLPVNKSHYTRGKAPMRQYMERCTVTDLWKVYSRQCEEKGQTHVSYHQFHHVLNHSYNISPR